MRQDGNPFAVGRWNQRVGAHFGETRCPNAVSCLYALEAVVVEVGQLGGPRRVNDAENGLLRTE